MTQRLCRRDEALREDSVQLWLLPSIAIKRGAWHSPSAPDASDVLDIQSE